MRLTVLVLALVSALPAAAQDLPPRKPGLWDMRVTFGPRHRPYAVRHCVDAATELALSPLTYPIVNTPVPPGYPIVNRCSPLKVNRIGADLTVEWTCNSGSETTTRAVISGSFETAYTAAMTRRTKTNAAGRVILAPSGPVYQSGPFDEQESAMLQATWLGPCEASHRPGDIIWPDGGKQRMDGQ